MGVGDAALDRAAAAAGRDPLADGADQTVTVSGEEGWPALSRERRHWIPPDDIGLAPRRDRQPFDYWATIPPEIGGVEPRFDAAVAADLENAAAALRHLDHSGAGDHLDAIATPLLRSESVASSRIEGLRTSHRRLAEALDDPRHAKATAREVAGNVVAMERALAAGDVDRPLTVADLHEIHRALLAHTRDAHWGGTVRQTQNWIGGPSNWAPRDPLFIPPPPEHVDRLLEDLVRFVNRTDMPAVAQAALAHAQFEAIHAYADGNGRTGRCLVHVALRRRLGIRVSPPVSAVLLADRDEYFAGLADYQTHGRPTPWVRQFAAATRIACERAEKLGAEIDDRRRDWLHRAGSPRADSLVRRTIELLPAHPILTAETLAARTGRNPGRARAALNELEQAAVLRRVTRAKRNVAWAADEVFDLLDQFDHDISAGRGPTRHLRARATRTD
jgi:Fic family protein